MLANRHGKPPGFPYPESYNNSLVSVTVWDTETTTSTSYRTSIITGPVSLSSRAVLALGEPRRELSELSSTGDRVQFRGRFPSFNSGERLKRMLGMYADLLELSRYVIIVIPACQMLKCP
jgi:hypothetical protein